MESGVARLQARPRGVPRRLEETVANLLRHGRALDVSALSARQPARAARPRPRAPRRRPSARSTTRRSSSGCELLERPKRGGGPERVRVQHAKSRMTVFERIKVLTDRSPTCSGRTGAEASTAPRSSRASSTIGGPRRRGLRPRLHAARGLDGRDQRRQARAPDLHGRRARHPADRHERLGGRVRAGGRRRARRLQRGLHRAAQDQRAWCRASA